MEVAIPAMIAGTGISAYGQYQAGKEQRSLSRAQAGAQAADAAAAREQSKEAGRLKRAEGRELAARTRVAYGGITGPTPMLVLNDTMDKIEQDAANMQRGGVNAYNRGMQESSWTRRAGRSAYRSGLWGAGSSLLTGLGTTGLLAYQGGMFGRRGIPATNTRWEGRMGAY